MPADRSSGRPPIAVGQRVGPYELVEALGEGAVGLVFRAVREDGQSVALKVLRDELADDPVYRRRFEREALVAGDLTHPHLVLVLGSGEAEGRLYLAARYIRGRSLADRLAAEGALQVADVVRLVGHVASGLDAMHERGLAHRDVKPANVLLDEDGAAALTDFGLARGEAHTVLTRSGLIAGTVDYVAPELIRGDAAGRASDVYALGCLAYECLGGKPPFAGRTVVDTLVSHVQDVPTPVHELRPEVPETVSWAVARALAKNAVDRPRSATAFARVLRAAASG